MYKKVLIFASIMVIAVACSQNTKKKSGQALEPSATATATDNSSVKDPHATEGTGFVKPSNAGILLDEIKDKYKGIKLSVADSKSKKVVSEVDVPFKARTAIPSTPFSVEVESFFTNFTMDNTGAINKSMDEANPASKVKLYKGDSLVFDGWLFQNFPEIHQFDDPNFTLLLVKGNKK